LYPVKSVKRLKEYKKCILYNLENNYIKKIVIFFENRNKINNFDEDYKFLNDKRCEIIDIDFRPTYQYIFKKINQMYPGEYIILTNADIQLDKTIKYGFNKCIDSKTMLMITRYNYNSKKDRWILQGNGKNYSSFDAWIFKAPIRKIPGNILIGVIGCDSYLAYLAQKAGFKIDNPCKTIKIKHIHNCGERNDKPKGFCYWNAKGYRGGVVKPSA